MASKDSKEAFLKAILAKKDLLFGKVSLGLTREAKDHAWETIRGDLIAAGHSYYSTKTAKEMRDNDWQNLRRMRHEKKPVNAKLDRLVQAILDGEMLAPEEPWTGMGRAVEFDGSDEEMSGRKITTTGGAQQLTTASSSNYLPSPRKRPFEATQGPVDLLDAQLKEALMRKLLAEERKLNMETRKLQADERHRAMETRLLELTVWEKEIALGIRGPNVPNEADVFFNAGDIYVFNDLMNRWEPGFSLWSEEAGHRKVPGVGWKIEVCPRGDDRDQPNYTLFFLHLTSQPTDVVLQNSLQGTVYTICLEQVPGPWIAVCERSIGNFGRASSSIGRAVAHKIVKNALRPDGSLRVVAEVQVQTPKPTLISEGMNTECFMSQLSLVGKMLDESFYFECCILVAGEALQAHKCLLSVNSSVFAEMVRSSTVIRIDEFQSAPVKATLDFIYKGHIDWSTYHGCETDVLQLAKKYALLGLEAYMECHITTAGIITTTAHMAKMAGSSTRSNAPSS